MNRDLVETKLREMLHQKMDAQGTAAGFAMLHHGETVADIVCKPGSVGAPDTNVLFNIGSLSKIYCTLAVMKLVQMGRLTLEDTVVQHLPELVMRDDRYREITLRMCLNHTSGLPGTDLRGTFVCRADRYRPNTRQLDYFAQCTLKTDPGTISTYCNDGFELARLVVERLSGMPYAAFVRAHITEPAGAGDTRIGGEPMAGAHHIVERASPEEFCMMPASGGALSSMLSCARIGALFLDPKGLFTADVLAEIVRRQGCACPPGTYAQKYGLGWDQVDFDAKLLDLGRGTLMKSGGTLSFTSFLLVCPKHDFAAVISQTNDCKMDALDMLQRLCATVLRTRGVNADRLSDAPAPDVPAPALPGDPMPADRVRMVEGIYGNYLHLYRVVPGETGIDIQLYREGRWEPFIEGARYVEQWEGSDDAFVTAIHTIRFLQQGDIVCMCFASPYGWAPYAQKVPPVPPMHPKWLERLGKRYILCNGEPEDLAIGIKGGSGGIRLSRLDDGDLLVVSAYNVDAPCELSTLVLAAAQPDDTAACLTASEASRDMFALFARDAHREGEPGAEYLQYQGYTFIEEAAIPYAPDGVATVLPAKPDGSDLSCVFRAPAGYTVAVEHSDTARVIYLAEDLRPCYDSMIAGADDDAPPPAAFVLVLVDVPQQVIFTLQVCDAS